MTSSREAQAALVKQTREFREEEGASFEAHKAELRSQHAEDITRLAERLRLASQHAQQCQPELVLTEARAQTEENSALFWQAKYASCEMTMQHELQSEGRRTQQALDEKNEEISRCSNKVKAAQMQIRNVWHLEHSEADAAKELRIMLQQNEQETETLCGHLEEVDEDFKARLDHLQAPLPDTPLLSADSACLRRPRPKASKNPYSAMPLLFKEFHQLSIEVP